MEQQGTVSNFSASGTTGALAARIEQCMLRDRHGLRRRLRSLGVGRRGRGRGRSVHELARDIEASSAIAQRRRLNLPAVSYPPQLPISQRRDEIASLLRDNQVVVICGETGSGKTTQLPKICLEIGRGIYGTIGHTQPRRIAARSVAARLAQEMNSPLGQAVGFKVRFADATSPDGYVKLMTDGILLAEMQNDRLLEQYDTLIIDEAHERSLNIDFILGYVKQLLPRRPDLKVIITSATIDPGRFSRHFGNAPVLTVSGRTFPVELRYRPLPAGTDDDEDIEQRQAVVTAVDDLWRHKREDVLVFLSGEREIREAAEALRARFPAAQAEILPLYARLSAEEQMRVFAPHEKPRIVLSTNVAETSLTVPGIRYVVDPGQARLSRYNPRSHVQRLRVEPISQASADQRKGRCGRVAEGVCVRLYSEEDYLQRDRFTPPEILRTNLASVILQMKALRLGNVQDFPFIDPPDYRMVRDGYQLLHELGAIDEANELTESGWLLAKLPIDPSLGRMILAARQEDCLEEVLVIAAALAVQDPRDRPIDHQHDADQAHARFRDPRSDFLGFLKLWQFWRDNSLHMGSSALRRACRESFLSYVRLREWSDVHRQLREFTAEMGWRRNPEPASYDAIHRALLTGLMRNIGVKGDAHEYSGLGGRKFHIFPGSSQFHRQPGWIVAAEVVETTRLYARTVASIRPEWIERLAGHMVKRTYTDAHWNRRNARVMAYEKVTFQGLTIVPRRPVHYGPVDPRASREIFIEAALVNGDYDSDARYLRHNRDLVRELELLEAKARRHDLVADAKARFAFYDARIPRGIYSGELFERWRQQMERHNRRVLFMSEQDLMLCPAGDVSESRFPNVLEMPGLSLPLSYRFDPGAEDDGVTLTVRLSALSRIPAERLEWLVPGMLEDKVIELIRSLPKHLRVSLVPAPDYARRAVETMPFASGPLLESLADALGKLSGVPLDPDGFQPAELPDFFRMNVRVIDESGRVLASGRDLELIRRDLRRLTRESFSRIPHPQYNRDDITEWDFGDLPQRVDIVHQGMLLHGYPAVVDLGQTAGLRLMDCPEDARRAGRLGVRRLFMLEFRSELSAVMREMPALERLGIQYVTLGGGKRLRDELLAAIADVLVGEDAGEVRTRMEFELRLDAAWNRLRPAAQEVLEIAERVLSQQHALALRLSRDFPPLLLPSIRDIRRHLAELVPPDFLSATPRPWLLQLPRYLRGIETRLAKLLNAGLTRDAEGMAIVEPLWQAYLDRRTRHRSAGVDDPELTKFRWMIEELRISLFAQELKTIMPISERRMEQQLQRIRSE